jgi:hypothetical protein
LFGIVTWGVLSQPWLRARNPEIRKEAANCTR